MLRKIVSVMGLAISQPLSSESHLKPSPHWRGNTCSDCIGSGLQTSRYCSFSWKAQAVLKWLLEEKRWLHKQYLDSQIHLSKPRSSSFSSHLDSKSHGGRGRVFHPAQGVHPYPSEGVCIFHSIKDGILHSGEKLWANLWCKTSNKVYWIVCRVIFKEDCLLEIFKTHRQKQCLCWTPKTLQHDNIWRFLNSQLFSLRAICSAFLIIPCLSGVLPALSQAICKLNIFWLISIFPYEQLDSILSSEYYWLL